jgi:hypothetical protein
LVVYGSAGGGHWSSESMIEEGAVVRNRQELIKLPDTSAMKVEVKIHESHINHVTLGLPAFVVLDSMPDQRFLGTVSKVAPLPDSSSRWGNPDLKLYATEVLITDKLPDVKPGVSARAEVLITNLPGVLSVPIQAVTTHKGKPVVFLAGAPQEPVPVTVGQYNTKFIQISSGLREGDQVLLAPPFDTKEKDLGGAIVADDEVLPAGATNFNGNGRASGEQKKGPPGSELLRPLPAGADAAPAGGPRAEGKRSSKGPRPGREQGGGSSTNRADMLKQFDADGDGQLNAEEQAALQRWAARRRGTNAPSAGPSAN